MTIQHAPRLGLPYPEIPGRPDTADIPRDISSLAILIDAIAAIADKGPTTSRPVSTSGTPGIFGRFWYNSSGSNAGHLEFDFGTGWIDLTAAGVFSIPDRSINHVKLILKTITGAEIADNTIDTLQIAAKAVTAAQIADALKPSAGAANNVEALRALGTGTGRAAQGTHAVQHWSTGADPLYNLVTTLPTSPLPSQEALLRIDDTINWHLRWNQPSGKWEFLGGNPIFHRHNYDTEYTTNEDKVAFSDGLAYGGIYHMRAFCRVLGGNNASSYTFQLKTRVGGTVTRRALVHLGNNEEKFITIEDFAPASQTPTIDLLVDGHVAGGDYPRVFDLNYSVQPIYLLPA